MFKMPYNPDIHHRRSIGLRGYDYSQAGLCFVTICIQNNECCFGKMADGKMALNDAGKTVQTIWNELPQSFRNAELDAFVVMPNHIHGIVVITNDEDTHRRGAIYRAQIDEHEQMTNVNMSCTNTLGAINRASATTNDASIVGGFVNAKNPMIHENLVRILRWFKGRAAFACRETIPYFAWQRNYYENINRDDKDYARIVEYIENNPIRWEIDRFYK